MVRHFTIMLWMIYVTKNLYLIPLWLDK